MQHFTHRRSFLHHLAAAAASVTLGGGASSAAAADPATGKLLFGFPPGSASARIGVALLKELHGHYQPDLGLELAYVAGAAGGRCIDALRKAAPDGATAMYLPSAPLTLTAQARSGPADNVLQTVLPVAAVAEFSFAFVVGAAVPAEVRSMADYARWLRQNQGSGGYGVVGTGSAPHYIGLSIARLADLPLTAVTYQGHVAQVKDLVSGTLGAAVLIMGSFEEHRRDGSLRALAVTGATRWPSAPELPTLLELGWSDVDVTSSLGVYLPAGSPAAAVQRLNAAVQQALRSPSFSALLSGSQMRAMPGAPADFAVLLAREQTGWAAIVKKERFIPQS